MKKQIHKTLNVPFINANLADTKKLLITLGCSYTVGVGAVDQDLLEKNPIIYSNGQVDLNLLNDNAKTNLLVNCNSITSKPDGKLDWSNMELDNCYGNVLNENYLNQSYTLVNLGRQAGGNYGPISRLFLYNIDYALADKIVVIFMPTGMGRLEFLDDTAENRQVIGGDTKTFWPGDNVVSFSEGSHARDFCYNYLRLIHSSRFEIEKTIIEFQILQQWCSLHNAELIVFPAFNQIYNKKYFQRAIQSTSQRDKDHNFIRDYQHISADAEDRVNKINWSNFVFPQASSNFYELCLKQEPTEYYRRELDLKNLPPISPNKFMLPCGHPSAKGHKLMAEEFYNIFKQKGLA